MQPPPAPSSEPSPLPPRVSVIMPAYNAAPFLSEAVESVLAQNTEVGWELLIVDDASTDGTLAVARQLAAVHPGCIRVLTHAGGEHRGSSASRNLALRHAVAPFTAFLDADDLWLPHALRTQLELMADFPSAALVYANAERSWDLTLPVDSPAGRAAGNRLPPLLPQGVLPGLLTPPLPLPWFLVDETLAPCTCTVMVRTAVARGVGGFEHSFAGLYDDQVFYAKLACAAPVAVSNTCIARYRHHPASCCVQAWNDRNAHQKARQQFEGWLATHCGESQPA